MVALMLLGYAHAQPADHGQPTPPRTARCRAQLNQTQPTDDSLGIYAVDIWQEPPQSWGPARGVYLGKDV